MDGLSVFAMRVWSVLLRAEGAWWVAFDGEGFGAACGLRIAGCRWLSI